MATAARELTSSEESAHPALAPETVVVRFAGDSGDGMQLTGGQFTLSIALAGNDLATFPDFPAEIRAPQGTLFGVSAFQINFGSTDITTAGDAPDVLVAMNPAALKTNVTALKTGGLIIADSGEFTKRNLEKAKYEANPLEDGSLAKWQLLAFDISALTMESVKPFGLSNKDALRCKNKWTLGLSSCTPASALRAAPSCSHYPAPPAARPTDGTAFSLPSSTAAIGPATSWS